jgi:spore coat protein CotH
MKTEKYKKIYEQKLIEYKNIIYQGNLALDILDDYLNLFKENNISNEIEYNFLFSNIENYILNFKY